MVTNSFGKKEKFHGANGMTQHALRSSPLFFSFPVGGDEKGVEGERGISFLFSFPLFPSSCHVVPIKFPRLPVFPILVLTKF